MTSGQPRVQFDPDRVRTRSSWMNPDAEDDAPLFRTPSDREVDPLLGEAPGRADLAGGIAFFGGAGRIS